MEQQVDENSNNSLLDLPENLLLHHILSEFAAAPHTLLHFSCTCKQANRLVNAPGLWASFCQASMANELAGCFADPELWRAASHKQLWIGLLLPFGQLLGRLWHSTTAPSGMLLAVDAEAPRLVARSIYYKTLNGGPFCHDVFAVELPGPDSKAVVTCWRDKHSADTFEGQAQLAPAAVAATGSAKSWTTAGTPAAVEESRIRPSGICPCSSSSSVVANLSTGFKLCCPGRCDSCAVEIASRRFASQQYAAAGQQHTAELLRQQASAHPPSSSGASGVISSSSAGGAAADSSSSGRILAQQQQQPHGELAPLPEMQQASTIDLFHIISLADMRNSFATPVFRPLDLSPWLPAAPMQAAARTGSNAAAAGSSVIAAGAAAAAAEVAEACAAASAAALSLPGCWRGTYGTHAIELVQLQLLLAPPGYDMFAAPAADGDAAAAAPAAAAGLDAADALAADSTADAAPGVLLGGVAGLASTAARHTGAAADAATADADEQQQQQDAAPVELEATQEQQQQQQRQQRQPLLVATKLTGDVNVPAGAVTFAADLGSRCSAGVGSRLVLPPGFDSDVQLNRAGMRQLRVKERYRGRAQIAYAEFDRPQVIAAELVLFDSPDCVGLLWKRPMDSFSLFSRASQLPRVPQA